MSDTSLQRFSLALPPALKTTLEAIAEREHRSLNGQIVFLLQKAADEDPDTNNVDLKEEGNLPVSAGNGAVAANVS